MIRESKYCFFCRYLFLISFPLSLVGCQDFEVQEAPYTTDSMIVGRDQWPSFLHDWDQDEKRMRADKFNVVGYRIEHDEYFFKCEISTELFDLLKSEWGLSQVDSGPRFISDFKHRMPKEHFTDEFTYFANENRIIGEKGPQIVVGLSPVGQILVGHYYFNF